MRKQLFENELRCNFNLVFILPFKVKSNHFALFERLCIAFGKSSMLANHHAILLFIMKVACDHEYKTYQKRKFCPFSNRLRKNKQTPDNCAECNWLGEIERVVWCVPSNLILTFRVRIESFPCQLPDVSGTAYTSRIETKSIQCCSCINLVTDSTVPKRFIAINFKCFLRIGQIKLLNKSIHLFVITLSRAFNLLIVNCRTVAYCLLVGKMIFTMRQYFELSRLFKALELKQQMNRIRFIRHT